MSHDAHVYHVFYRQVLVALVVGIWLAAFLGKTTLIELTIASEFSFCCCCFRTRLQSINCYFKDIR